MKHRIAVLTVVSSLALVGGGCKSEVSYTAPNQPSNPVREANDDARVPPAGMPNGGGSGMMKPQTPPELTAEQKTELAAGEAAHKPKELTFHMNSGSFFFVPNMIKVKKGDKVKIVYKNVGGMHNFVLDEFGVRIDPIKTDAEQTIEFAADKVGSFEYYCSVGKHRQMGQKGQLVVTE